MMEPFAEPRSNIEIERLMQNVDDCDRDWCRMYILSQSSGSMKNNSFWIMWLVKLNLIRDRCSARWIFLIQSYIATGAPYPNLCWFWITVYIHVVYHPGMFIASNYFLTSMVLPMRLQFITHNISPNLCLLPFDPQRPPSMEDSAYPELRNSRECCMSFSIRSLDTSLGQGKWNCKSISEVKNWST